MADPREIARQLAATQAVIDRALAGHPANVAPFLSQLSSQVARAVEVAQGTFARAVASIARAEAWDIHQRQYATAMLALGWPPVQDLYVDQVREIVTRFDQDDPQALAAEVSEFLVEFYDDGALAAKLDDWRALRWVEKRLPILEKVIGAHSRGDYELSVPGMLPQIEGVVATGFAHTGRLGGKKLDGLLDRLLASTGDAADAAYRQYIDTVLLVGFEHGLPMGSGLSRHAILHGADTTYATVENSLRTILLFDHLLTSFRLVSLGHSAAVHVPGCVHVVRSSSSREVFRDMRSALSSGKRACKTCRPDLHRSL